MEARITAAAPRPVVAPRAPAAGPVIDDAPAAKGAAQGDVKALATDTEFRDAGEVNLDDIQVEDAPKGQEAEKAAEQPAEKPKVDVESPEFAAKAKEAWATWGKANSNTKLSMDPSRFKRLKERVAKGDSLEKAIGFLYSGGALTNMMMAKYFRQVEEESQRRRARGG